MKFFLGVVVVLIVGFTANNQYQKYRGEKAYQYFKSKCEAEAGEFIYRTVDDVQGLYQMRLRDPRDYFYRLHKGDIPEDPYGHTNIESQNPWEIFLSYPGRKYDYLETKKSPPSAGYLYAFKSKPVFLGHEYWRYEVESEPVSNNGIETYTVAKNVSKLKSDYGFYWEGFRNEIDEYHGVWGGRISVVDLKSNEILGVKQGYFIFNEYDGGKEICPLDKQNGLFLYDFISKVLKPKLQE